MSSQTQIQCHGFEIEQNFLIQCNNQCMNKYCENHEHKYRLEKPNDCAICMDHVSEQTEIPLECGHWFHKQCLLQTNKHVCPMCRQPMYQNEIEYIFGSNNQNVQNDFDLNNIGMYNNLEHFMNDFPYEFSQQNWNQFVYENENENEIQPIYNNDPFADLQDDHIDAILRDIEISPRNNPFVNVLSSLNIVNPEREDDLEEFIMNIIENYSLMNNHHIDVFAGDIIIRIMSVENDLRLFSIGFNLQYQPLHPNLYLRILTVMENRIQDIYQRFHQ